MVEVKNGPSTSYANGFNSNDNSKINGAENIKSMEIIKDDETGDLFKNGEKYRRFNGNVVKEKNVTSNSESGHTKNKENGFTFHAQSNDALTSDILISTKENLVTDKHDEETSGTDFKYHANEDVEYQVITSRSNKSSRSQLSPDYQNHVDNNRKQQVSYSKNTGQSNNPKTVSLNSLQQLKPPAHPVIKHKSNDITVKATTYNDNTGTPSPRKQDVSKESSLQNQDRYSPTVNQKKNESSVGLGKNNIGRKAVPEKGILKKTHRNQNKGNATVDNEYYKTEEESHSVNGSQQINTKNGITYDSNISHEQSNKGDSNQQRGHSPDKQTTDVEQTNRKGADEKPPLQKQTTTRLPPTGQRNSLVANGDVNHQRLPPANKKASLVGNPNGDINSNKKNENNRNKSEKHVSSIQKNGVSTSQSNRTQATSESNRTHVTSQSNRTETTNQNKKTHENEKNDTDKMSAISSKNRREKSAKDENRNVSPNTDSSEYRIRAPRNGRQKGFIGSPNRRENGHIMSPRTEKSLDSRTTSSETRGRSKEFTFRWNAPSRNQSPDMTEKSSSPPLKQFKPSAQIQSFYSYLYGRSKKRKSLPTSPSKPKGILVQKETSERGERPRSFVLLRSKTVQRSAWDNNPTELTYKPSTTKPEEITHAYIGEDSIREAEMNARLQQMQEKPTTNKVNKTVQKRSKVPPWYDNDKYVLNRRQAGVYRNMTNAYGKETKGQREYRFVQKLAEYEVYKAKMQWEQLLEKEKRQRAAKERQMLQLNEVRQRFEDEAWHRFHTQYVTSRVLEHEKMNRSEYGLPEDDEEEPENRPIIKRKKVVPKSLITEDMIKDIYQKKFNKMFEVNKGNGLGRRPKTPKMEGIDTVVLEEKDEAGHVREKKRMVKDVINAAEKQLKENKEQRKKLASPTADKNTTEDRIQSIRDLDLDDDSDDDDMDDIFEKARRKYDLDVDD